MERTKYAMGKKLGNLALKKKMEKKEKGKWKYVMEKQEKTRKKIARNITKQNLKDKK